MVTRRIQLAASLLFVAFVGLIPIPGKAHAETFDLIVPGSNVRSTAVLTSNDLTITDHRGRATRYLREPRFDAAGSIAYHSRAARQVIRWPVSGAGAMGIGSVGPTGTVRFRQSQMRIQRRRTTLRPNLGGPRLPPPPNALSLTALRTATFVTLTTQDADRASLQLGIDNAGRPAMSAAVANQYWQLAPLGNSLFRIQCFAGRAAYCLAARRLAGGRADVIVASLSNDPNQLWSLQADPANPRIVRITNAAISSRVLGGGRDGILALERPSYSVAQAWILRRRQPAAGFVPVSRFISHAVRPNPPLRPATVRLTNPHRNVLWVALTDRRRPAQITRVKIPAKGSTTIELDRDAGVSLVETHELRTPRGTVQRQFVTGVPPAALYDLSVYELHLQSIAIDRTGPRPVVDETNYQPKSLGWFEAPPGKQLPDEATLDVYTTAKDAGNPGAVRRIDPARWTRQSQPLGPLEKQLKQLRAK